jgi:RHS repeat-associated protein
VTLQSFDYSLDPVGHRKVITEQNGRKVEYEYDDLYRLRSETIFAPAGAPERTISYGYDAVGNRLSKTDSVGGVTTYTYDDNDRLLKEELKQDGALVGSVEYGYDNNGNTKTKTRKDAAGNGVETVTYSWNKENRLVGVQNSNGDVVSYSYDADGVRVSKTVNGVTTEYLVDNNRDYAQVLEESVDDVVTASYVYGWDLISQERGNVDSFYLVDGLGSTRGLTNTNGLVTDTYTYDAFGNLIASAGGTANDYLFAGEQFDPSLGDYYLRQRYYSPSVGRFSIRDTYEGSLEDPMSLHKYLYANANPISFIDPTGRFSIAEQTVIMGVLTSLAIEGGRAAFAPAPAQAPEPGGNSSDPLESQRELYDRLTFIGGLAIAGLAGFRVVAKNGTEFLAYLGESLADDAGRYISPVGAAVRGQFFPKGAWIERKTFEKLATEAGSVNKTKFITALKKSIEQGTVAPINQQGIKVLAQPYKGYTHELKINGSAARILGKFDENGVLIFDEFLPKGLH